MSNDISPKNAIVQTTEEMFQIVAFEQDNEEYAIYVEDVKEVIKKLEITPIPNSPKYIAGFINLRGKIISIIDLEVKFNLKRETSQEKIQNIIVIDSEPAPFGVIVDKVIEVLKVPRSAIQDAPESINSKIGNKYIKGVIVVKETREETEQEIESITPDDNQRVLLLLDLKELLNAKEKDQVKEITKSQG